MVLDYCVVLDGAQLTMRTSILSVSADLGNGPMVTRGWIYVHWRESSNGREQQEPEELLAGFIGEDGQGSIADRRGRSGGGVRRHLREEEHPRRS